MRTFFSSKCIRNVLIIQRSVSPSLSKYDIFISAMKIHVSPDTKSLLDKHGGFNLEPRGNIEIKVGAIIILILISDTDK